MRTSGGDLQPEEGPGSLLRWHGKCYYLLFVWLA
jgi:hypothetical protein